MTTLNLSTASTAVNVGNLALADPNAKQKQLLVGRFFKVVYAHKDVTFIQVYTKNQVH